MTGTNESTPRPRRRARQALAFGALCVLLVGAAVASSAGARSAKTLGKTRHTPAPDCPKSPCEGIGSVTGFPIIADGKNRPFNVHRNGKLVAWALDLSRPTKDQRNFFGTVFKSARYGTAPTARISVLRRVGKARYKLQRQSPVVKLGSALGHREIFTLDKPLSIRKGTIVALTVPSWASSFASHVAADANQWRASRTKGDCSPKSANINDVKAFANKSRPQQSVGSTRRYGCDYKGARLLYWAYYVPSH